VCKELIEPMERFFMNNFKFIDVTPEKLKKRMIKKGIIGIVLEAKSGKKELGNQ
jgi:hypothetical protein